MGWQSIADCPPPRDGTPFLVIQSVTVIRSHHRQSDYKEQDVDVVRRQFYRPGSCGHWMGRHRSYADHELRHGLWQLVPTETGSRLLNEFIDGAGI